MTAKERAVAATKKILDDAETDRPSLYAPWRAGDYERISRHLSEAIEAAILEEREACAMVAMVAAEFYKWPEMHGKHPEDQARKAMAHNIFGHIRKRGQQ